MFEVTLIPSIRRCAILCYTSPSCSKSIILSKKIFNCTAGAVIFSETPEEAIAQAAEQDLAGDWEGPETIEVPPQGYRIIYDPKQFEI